MRQIEMFVVWPHLKWAIVKTPIYSKQLRKGVILVIEGLGIRALGLNFLMEVM